MLISFPKTASMIRLAEGIQNNLFVFLRASEDFFINRISRIEIKYISMPKSRKQKEQIVKDLADKLKESKSLVLSNYQGMTVAEVQELKKKLKAQDGDFSVVKNSLFKLALKEAGIKDAEDKLFEGPVAVSFSKDEVLAAKETHLFSKDCKALEIQEGYLEGKTLSKEEIKNLAMLPSKEELIAKTVGTIKAPVSSFVNVLGGTVRGIVTAIKAIADQKS